MKSIKNNQKHVESCRIMNPKPVEPVVNVFLPVRHRLGCAVPLRLLDKVIHVMTLQGIQVRHIWQQNDSVALPLLWGESYLNSLFLYMLLYFPPTLHFTSF